MIDQDTLDAAREAVVTNVRDDWVGLWVIPWWFERLCPGLSDDEMREASIVLVRTMCEAIEIVVGDLAGPLDFRPWQLTTDEVVKRIDEEWRRLGHTPSIGEVAWFSPGGA